ncbi:MAG: pilus assembly protein N-terminal domain-containing protein [Deltaproteobacteria bacterium]|nr:pilus assembly protein N-terminal domain-containing protein [Deltaproteobacteria bacterium]
MASTPSTRAHNLLAPLLLAIWAAPLPAEAQDIVVLKGRQHLVESGPLERAAGGDPTVADIRLLRGDRQVLIVGKAPGSTDLILWRRRGGREQRVIRVITSESDQLEEDLHRLVGPLEGIRVRTIGGRIVIDGTAYRQSDYQRVAAISRAYGNVTNLVQLGPQARSALGSLVSEALRRAGLTRARAVPLGGNLFLLGEVESQEDLERARTIATAFGEDVRSLLRSPSSPAQMVFMDVKMMEINRRRATALGIDWQDAINITGKFNILRSGAEGAGPRGVAVAEGISATINLLMQKGDARILANPKLVARSGHSADFLAGGEIPVVVVGQYVSRVEWKRYGIMLAITPEVRPPQAVSTQIRVEVSTLDRANAVQGIPGILTRRVATAVLLRPGQTVILSGLLSHEASKDVDKVPLLGQIPVLGELFKSRHFQNRLTELAIFVTPALIVDEDPASQRTLTEMRERYDRAGETLKFHLMD